MNTICDILVPVIIVNRWKNLLYTAIKIYFLYFLFQGRKKVCALRNDVLVNISNIRSLMAVVVLIHFSPPVQS